MSIKLTTFSENSPEVGFSSSEDNNANKNPTKELKNGETSVKQAADKIFKGQEVQDSRDAQNGSAHLISRDLTEIESDNEYENLSDLFELAVESINEESGKQEVDTQGIKKSIQNRWVKVLQDELAEWSGQDLFRIINETRDEIFALKRTQKTKEDARSEWDQKIKKGEKHITYLQSQLPKKLRGGKRTRSRIQSIMSQVALHQERVQKLQSKSVPNDSYRQGINRREQVRELMAMGNLKPVKGGKSGVYFLCDTDNNPKFVVKPIDEEMLALNNSKGFALPFLDYNRMGRPKSGIPLYHSVQNAELSYEIARYMGIERCTPRCEAMILRSEKFSDLTDNITENREKLLELAGSPDKEKLCLVQEYIPDCREFGDIILSNLKISQTDLMAMNYVERDKLIQTASPDNIDHKMYEQGVILAWVTGEKDGNAGNFMVADTINPRTGKRDIYKIDCAASSPEDNINLTSGASWVANNYTRNLSDYARSVILKIKPGELAKLMRSGGKSEESIQAMIERVDLLQYFVKAYKELSIEDLDIVWMDYFQPNDEPTMTPEEHSLLTTQLDMMNKKIKKAEGHIKHLQGQLPKKMGGGKRSRSRQQSIKNQILITSESIRELEKEKSKIKIKLQVKIQE